MRMTPADKKAKGLAKKILKKDFDKLFKQGYIRFTIKIKNGRLQSKRMIIAKDFCLYGYNSRDNRYYRYCSLIRSSQAWQYEQNVYPQAYYDNHYSPYDKIVAYYLWLKEYAVKPVPIKKFKEQFNLIDDPHTWYRLKKELKEKRGF